MKKANLLFVISLLFFSTLASAANQYPVGSPTRAIQDLDKKMESFRTGQLTPADEAFNKDLKKDIIHGTFDIRELAKLSLYKHWDGLTEAQRNEFVELLTNILEEKAILSKEQSAAKSKKGGKYKVTYAGHKFIGADKKKAFVTTSVYVYSEDLSIRLNYKLRYPNGEWKIYDVIVDDASLVNNYRYQFNSIITKHGFNDLMARMKSKLKDIQAKRKE
ncbi:MAG: ABC transporter substrate-binding protein [Pseudomonadota bacterium]